MVCTLIDYRNNVNMLKSLQQNHSPATLGYTWLLNILTLFLCSVREPTKNIVFDIFTITLVDVEIHLDSSFSKIRAEKKDKNKLCHHHIISMVCNLIDRTSRQKSTREIAQLL